MIQHAAAGRSPAAIAPAAHSSVAAADQPQTDALTIQHVSKRYGPTRALDDVSFTVQYGQIHALLGGNGSGKSTLIKALAGVVHPDAGQITIGAGEPMVLGDLSPRRARTAGLRFVHQDPPIFPELSIAENLALGSSFDTDRIGRVQWRRQNRSARQTLARFEIDADPRQAASSLRPAGRALLSIARVLGDNPASGGVDGLDERPRVLVLDEPTASLPHREVDRLLTTVRRLAGSGIVVVLVDHRLDEIIQYADSFTVLRDGHHVLTEPMAGHTAHDLARFIVGGSVSAASRRSADRVVNDAKLEVEQLSAGGARDVSVSVEAGEIVGLAGLSGAGSSSTLRAIAGELPRRSGRVLLGDVTMNTANLRQVRRAGIVYVPDERRLIGFADMDLAANISAGRVARFWHHGILSSPAEHRAATKVLHRYHVAAPSRRSLASLSGGNQQKVVVAAALDLKPRVLLLDEPTRGVDVRARAAIHDLIRTAAAEGTIVLVASSDLAELVQLSDRVVVLRRGRVAEELTGEALNEHTLLTSIQNGQIDTVGTFTDSASSAPKTGRRP